MTEFDHPEVTLCIWQDFKIQLLTNKLNGVKRKNESVFNRVWKPPSFWRESPHRWHWKEKLHSHHWKCEYLLVTDQRKWNIQSLSLAGISALVAATEAGFIDNCSCIAYHSCNALTLPVAHIHSNKVHIMNYIPDYSPSVKSGNVGDVV